MTKKKKKVVAKVKKTDETKDEKPKRKTLMIPMSELPYHLGLKMRIYPNNEQKRLIAINSGISLPIEKAVEVEEKLFGDCFETHDQKEGMACFLSREKPKPKAVFTNN